MLDVSEIPTDTLTELVNAAQTRIGRGTACGQELANLYNARDRYRAELAYRSEVSAMPEWERCLLSPSHDMTRCAHV